MDLMLMMAIGCVAMLAGFLGCFLPVLPGPAIAYAALYVLFAFGCPPTTTQLIVGEYSFDDYEKYQQQLADGGLQKAIDCLNAYLFDTAPVAIKLPEKP